MSETCPVCNGSKKCKGNCDNGWQPGSLPRRGCVLCDGDGGIGPVKKGEGHCITCDGTGMVEKQGFPFS